MKTDTQLLTDYLDGGDRSAFDQLMARHYPHVFQVALRLVHNEFDARDVAQNVFVKALDRAAQVRDRAKFRAWLLRVTVNEVRAHWRKRKPVTPLDELQAAFEEARDTSVDSAASRREFELELEKALERMPARLKVPLVLHYYQSLSLAEVAAILELPKSTVQHRVNKAVARLRRRFTKRNARVLLPLLAARFPAIPAAQSTAGAAGVTTAGALAVKTKLALLAAVLLIGVGVVLWTADDDPPAAPTHAGSTSPDDADPLTAEDGGLAGRAADPAVDTAPDATSRMASVQSTGPGRITGRVVALASGAAVAGARIALSLPPDGVDGLVTGIDDDAFENVYWSADDGTFVCDHLPTTHAYMLTVTHPDYAYAQVGRLRFPPYATEADAGAIPLVAARSVTGRVVDESGAPIAGARVRAGSPHKAPMPLDFAHPPAPLRGPAATTGASGAFELTGLSEGYHRLTVHADGYATTALAHLAVPATEPVEIRMPAARVFRGIVRDPEGTPLADVPVDIDLSRSIRAGRQGFVSTSTWRRLRTDDGGRFSVSDLPVGVGNDPVVSITHPGYEQLWRDYEGIPADEVIVVLTPTRAPGGHALTLRFVDEGGAPITGAPGVLTVSAESAEGTFETETPLSTQSDTAQVPGIPPGAVYVSASVRGYQRTGLELTMPDTAHEHTITLPRGAVARGRVVDATTGKPIASARVINSEVNRVETDADGRFVLWGLRGGRTLIGALSAQAEGYLPRGVTVPFAQGAEEVDLEIRLFPTSTLLTLKGRVLGDDGTGIGGASLSIQLSRGQIYSRRARTRGDGSFEIRGVDPSHLQDQMHLRVAHPQHALVHMHITREATKQPIEVRMVRGRTVRGRVVDQHGAPVVGASVGALSKDRWFTLEGDRLTPDNIDRWTYGLMPYLSGSAATDADGRFELRHMPADALQLVAFHAMTNWLIESGRTGAHIERGAGDIDDALLTVRRGWRVAGRVVGPGGAPLPGLFVRAEGVHISARTDFRGRFDLSPVFIAETEVIIRSDHYGARVKTPSDRAGDLQLDAVPHASVRGRIVDTQGNPVAGATVRAPGGVGVATVASATDGTFTLHGVRIGEVVIEITLESRTAETTHTVVHRETGDLGDIRLP